MKYARVYEDGLGEYLTSYQEHCEHVAALNDSGYDFEGDIVKSSNDIEALIDEVVCDEKVQPLVNVFKGETKAQQIKNTCEYLFCRGKKDIKLAIWTETGLIYVAKINDTGKAVI